MAAILLAAMLALSASAQGARADALATLQARSALARACDDPGLDLPSPRGFDPEGRARDLLAAMLRTDPRTCPGLADAALVDLRAELGEPERSDVDLELLALAWDAAEHGRGTAPDPGLADRYGRVLWLFADDPPILERWPAVERQAWLVRPETIGLLVARNADRTLRTPRSLMLLAELRLRLDLPGYDPAAAVDLLEDSRLMTGLDNRLRFSGLLTEGKHLPPDYLRAAQPYLFSATSHSDANPYQAELLRIARLAMAAASVPVEEARALRMLSAAALDGHGGSGDDLERGLRRLGRVPTVPLAPGDAERVGRALDWSFAWNRPYGCGDESRRLVPVVLAALIGPDGRVVTTRVARSSGAAECDRGVRGTWAERGERADLGETADGRFVWAELPPVDLKFDTYDAHVRWSSTEP